MTMEVKILEAHSSKILEELTNEFLEENSLVTELEFHYSTSSYGSMSKGDGKNYKSYSVLIVMKDR